VIAVEEMSDEQFLEHVLGLLQKELGLDGMARFLRTYRPGSGDYTRDRHKWLNGITIEQILKEAQELQHPAAD
jgi:hypothetical protein